MSLIHTEYKSGLYEIDFRFDLDSDDLDLGEIGIGESDTVPVGVRIQSMEHSSVKGLLGWGDAPSLFSDPSLDTTCLVGIPDSEGKLPDPSPTSNALVTLEFDDVAGNAVWRIQSDPSNSMACLWEGHSNFGGKTGTEVEIPFDFTIVIDP